MTHILFDIMYYAIMMTTTPSIIGFYGAGVALVIFVMNHYQHYHHHHHHLVALVIFVMNHYQHYHHDHHPYVALVIFVNWLLTIYLLICLEILRKTKINKKYESVCINLNPLFNEVADESDE